MIMGRAKEIGKEEKNRHYIFAFKLPISVDWLEGYFVHPFFNDFSKSSPFTFGTC